MSTLQHKHGGVVLAAGASSRMGQAKALLPDASGEPLALAQSRRLVAAGVSEPVIVLGHQAEALAAVLDDAGARLAYHPGWAQGRVSSLQAGLRAVGSVYGAVILPVDTVGLASATLPRLLAAADGSNALAVRPLAGGKRGQVLWLSAALFEDVLGIEPDPGFRFDAWIAGRETTLELGDPALLHNANTPEEWRRLGGRGPARDTGDRTD
jgi:molybdenum cofactor cytidylyltransferase